MRSSKPQIHRGEYSHPYNIGIWQAFSNAVECCNSLDVIAKETAGVKPAVYCQGRRPEIFAALRKCYTIKIPITANTNPITASTYMLISKRGL